MRLQIQTGKDWDNTLRKLNTFIPAVVDEVNKEFLKTSLKIRYRMIAAMESSMPDLGKGYLRPKGYPNPDMISSLGPIHFASRPGSSPRSDYGNLIKSFRVKARKNEVVTWSKLGEDSGTYPGVLEQGSRDGRLKPRPFMGPAFEKSVNGIDQRIINRLARIR